MCHSQDFCVRSTTRMDDCKAGSHAEGFYPMKQETPFEEQSPYVKMEHARRQRLMIGILNTFIIITPILLVFLGLLFAKSISTHTILVLVDVARSTSSTSASTNASSRISGAFKMCWRLREAMWVSQETPFVISPSMASACRMTV